MLPSLLEFEVMYVMFLITPLIASPIGVATERATTSAYRAPDKSRYLHARRAISGNSVTGNVYNEEVRLTKAKMMETTVDEHRSFDKSFKHEIIFFPADEIYFGRSLKSGSGRNSSGCWNSNRH